MVVLRSAARLVEPIRGVYRPRDMWRSVLLGVVVAGLVSGCGSGMATGGGDCTDGTMKAGGGCDLYTPGEIAAMQVSQMRIPPRNSPPLWHVACLMVDSIATCTGTLKAGTTVHVRFRRRQNQSLVPLCPSHAHPKRPPSLFCVD